MHAWEYREAGRGGGGGGGGRGEEGAGRRREQGGGGAGAGRRRGQRARGKEGAGRQGERRGEKGGEGMKFQQKISLRRNYCSLSGSSKVLSAYSHTCDGPNDPIKAHHAGTGECRCNTEHKDSTNEAAQDETK